MESRQRSAVEIYKDYNAAENKHDLPGTTALLATDLFVRVNGKVQVSSSEEDERAMAILYDCYPDYRREIVAILDAGNQAAIQWKMMGTPSTRFPGLEPLEVSGVSIVTSNGNVLTRAELYADSIALNEVLNRARNLIESDNHG